MQVDKEKTAIFRRSFVRFVGPLQQEMAEVEVPMVGTAARVERELFGRVVRLTSV